MILTSHAKRVNGKIIPIKDERVVTEEEIKAATKVLVEMALYRAGQGFFETESKEANQ